MQDRHGALRAALQKCQLEDAAIDQDLQKLFSEPWSSPADGENRRRRFMELKMRRANSARSLLAADRALLEVDGAYPRG